MARTPLTPGQSPEQVTRRVLRTPAAADYTGLSPSTLEKLRLAGGGPRFLRLGGRAVGYDVRDLDDWLDRQREATDDDSGQPRSAA